MNDDDEDAEWNEIRLTEELRRESEVERPFSQDGEYFIQSFPGIGRVYILCPIQEVGEYF